MKEEDIKKIQELALKQLLDANEAQTKQINDLQLELARLKERLGSNASNSEIDVNTLVETNKILSLKVTLLEADIQRFRQEETSSFSITEEKQTSEKTDRKDIKKRLIFTAIDSFSLYIIAYIVSFLLYNYVTIFTGRQFGLHGVLQYWGIKWLGKFNIELLDSEQIIKIFVSGSLVCLILAAILYVLLKLSKNIYYKYRLILAWISLICLNQFFGNFISGIITGKGFAYVPTALGIEFNNDIFIVLFMILLMYILGAVITKTFLFAASSFSLAEKQKRFLLYLVLYPSIAGNILILLFKLPEVSAYEFLSMFFMYIMIIPMFYRSSLIFVSNRVITINKNYRLTSYNKEIIVFALLLLIAIRIFM